MTNSLKLGIAGVFLFQLIIAASFGLSHDEAYYWLFSRHLDWGYFDHPPFMAVTIALFSFFPHGEFAVRAGFVALQAGTVFFLFQMIDRKYWTTAFLLFFSFPLASYTGLLALPDMPLLFMTSVYFYFLRKYLAGEKSGIFGLIIAIPLLLYAKYHGILLIFFTILSLPRLLLRKDFWLIAICSVLLFAPHLWWQYEHEFATLRYHFLERPSSSFSIQRVLDYLGTQIILTALLCGPVIWWQLAKYKARDEFTRVLVFTSWGIVAFFLVSTISKKVEANWTISLAIPLTVLLADCEIWKRSWAKALLAASFTIAIIARLVFVFPSLPMKRLAEFHGWKEWAQEVKGKCGDRKILANSYQIASKLSFYLNTEISALNYHSRKNQFDLWKWNPTGVVCYVTDKAEFQGEEIKTPDQKTQKLVLNMKGEDLLAKKLESLNQKTDKP
ncbi:MAG: ArnT family glycosyltransferase [Bacteriovoracaceae bacterium]